MNEPPLRLDLLLLKRGLATTRTKAQELIEAGKVSVDGKPVLRSGEKILPACEISLSEAEHPYVSRGGLKLEAALAAFGIDVKGMRVLDVGQSTGGFTHCLLLRGACAVVGVDVGKSQLAAVLKADSRVLCLEKQDIRTVCPEQLGPPFSFFVADLSFISLRLILPVLPRLLVQNATGVLLMKPQFEVGQKNIGAGGIVRDAAARDRAVAELNRSCGENGFTVAGVMPSPITGGDGNMEFLFHLKRISSGAAI